MDLEATKAKTAQIDVSGIDRLPGQTGLHFLRRTFASIAA